MPHRSALTMPHFFLALAVAAVWGTNFVVIRLGLDQFPPFLFAALRFTLVFFPAALFLKRPDVPLRRLFAYAMLIGSGQFALLFMGIKMGLSPGLASLVIQVQVFFTIGLSVLANGERVRPHQIAAVVLAACGIAIIAVMGGGDATVIGLLLVLAAGLSWASGNMVAKRDPGVNMLAYVTWSGLFAAPPLFAMSLIFDGPAVVAESLANANAVAWGATIWQAVGNSLFGYAAWGWLLARYPAATVAPMSLLVPVFGMSASAWWLGEALPAWKLEAAAIVFAGLAINLFWPVRAQPKPA